MKRFAPLLIMLGLLAFAGVTLVAADASAQRSGPSNLTTRLGDGGLDGTDDLQAARTATFADDTLEGYGLLVMFVTVTDADDTVDSLSMACTAEHTSGGASFRIPACVWDAANLRFNCEAGPLHWDPSDETAADTKLQMFRVDVEGVNNATCVFTPANGGAADFILNEAYATVKG